MERAIENNKRGLSGAILKYVAIVAMTLDHIATGFFAVGSAEYIAFRAIGRLTIPIMCFLLVEGFCHTHSVPKYLLRLFLFGAVSYLPYVLYFYTIQTFALDFLLELFLALGLLYAINLEAKAVWRVALALAFFVAAVFCDAIVTTLLVLLFYVARGDKRKELLCILAYAAICVIPWFIEGNATFAILNLGVLLALPLPFFYDGTRGKGNCKWLFYCYYPLHILILWLIRDFLI